MDESIVEKREGRNATLLWQVLQEYAEIQLKISFL